MAVWSVGLPSHWGHFRHACLCYHIALSVYLNDDNERVVDKMGLQELKMEEKLVILTSCIWFYSVYS